VISACRQHLERVLREAQIPQVFHDAEKLSQHQVLPFAVVLAGREDWKRDGSRVATADSARRKARTYRRRAYRREVAFTVILVSQEETRAEGALLAVLREAGAGFLDEAGNWHRARVDAVRWQDDPSLVRQRAVVEIEVTFQGGLYRDEEVPLIQDVRPEAEGA
jgi:hypothetical protein